MTRNEPLVVLRHVLMTFPSGMSATATLPLSATKPNKTPPKRHGQRAVPRFPHISAPPMRTNRVPWREASVPTIAGYPISAEFYPTTASFSPTRNRHY
jgi:hypothetical protein